MPLVAEHQTPEPGHDALDQGDEAIPMEKLNHQNTGPLQIALVEEDDTICVPLGLEALDPSFSLSDFLISKGLGDSALPDQYAAQYNEHLTKFQSPFSWSTRKKIIVLCGAFVASTLASYSAGGYALGLDLLRLKWSLTDIEYNVGLTLFVIGFGIAPMILAPVSEAYGRYWIFAGAGVVFFLGTLGCAVTDSFAGMLVSRLVVGNGASVYATITGGIISDMYHKENRNTPMALYSLSIMAGTGLGPLVSGIAVDSLGWRWIFYIQVITVGITTLVMFLTFQETRGNVLLQKKCVALNKMFPTSTTSRTAIFFQPQGDEMPAISLKGIGRSFTFPLRLLVTEPVVFWFSLWAAFAWAILYMQFSSISIVFKDVYGFNNAQVGAMYVSVIIASFISTFLALAQGPMMRRLWPESDKISSPEGRLLSPGFQSILLPIGLFWFGWTARSDISWIFPCLAVGSCTMGIFSIYLAVFNYIADTYHRYASSALAAQSLCRNLLAGIFPLFTGVMLKTLTYKGTGSLLGGLGLLLTAIPWTLSFYGERIRARSPLACGLAQG